ncbi:HAD family hydrolase [Granulicella sibirica]|uniref:phosphoglycolate phosphatase n=1 Tax=Granulicella sibirica TaxID=2479048 RepID=A0A4Q0T3R6_9BACT|nr:HAD hydrolase-like protein [Granulicella sibirica]RXH56629.1 Phosphoglycolate phosphatase [Granulicella sibirica]
MTVTANPRLLIFDLDGTLIDSRQDLCNSVNATLAHLGRSALPDAVIASYIGDGASMLIRRALGDPDQVEESHLNQAISFFLDYYRIHKLDFTYVYPGVLEALASIRGAHPTVPMAVLTNKPVHPSRDICAHFGLDRFFFQNYGGNSFHTKKPDPHGIQTLIAEANALAPNAEPITPAQTVMIGDSDVDILTARNAGARSLGCTFGLSPHALAAAQPEATVDSPTEWPATLFA